MCVNRICGIHRQQAAPAQATAATPTTAPTPTAAEAAEAAPAPATAAPTAAAGDKDGGSTRRETGRKEETGGGNERYRKYCTMQTRATKKLRNERATQRKANQAQPSQANRRVNESIMHTRLVFDQLFFVVVDAGNLEQLLVDRRTCTR